MAALAYVLLLAIVALGVPLAINLRARVNAEVRTQAQGQADLVAATAADLLSRRQRKELTTLASTAASSVRGRILIVDARGGVLVDTAGNGQLGSSYESRPEIQAALAGRQIQVQRHSNTLRQEILATAVPVIRNGHPVGAVRVTQSVAAVNSAVRRSVLGLMLLGLVVLALGLAAGALIAAQVVRPIRRLEHLAARVSAGDLPARAKLEGSREQRSLAASFNHMTERTARLLRAQRDFVADASHQLRTPLTGLRLRLEETRALASESVEEQVDAAIAEVDRLSHTVDELMVLSGADARQVAPSAVGLDEVAASAAERWRAKAADSGKRLELIAGTDGGCVLAATPDLERALDVLIENAIQYAPRQTTVWLRTAPGRIEVCDQGPGISETERELVFERFHRGEAGRAGPPGSGLGLPIARELSRKWGGDVAIATRSGGGTVATLTFPAHEAAASSPDASALPSLNLPTGTVD